MCADPAGPDKETISVYLEAQIKLYFGMTDKGDISPILFGETSNACLRGCVISNQSSQKKLHMKLSQLEEEAWRQSASAAYHPLQSQISNFTTQAKQSLPNRISTAFTGELIWTPRA